MVNKSFRCPVCDENENALGVPFNSEWAVAYHIAGKIKHAWRDKLHKAWARQNHPGLDFSSSMPHLAQNLLLAVHQGIETDRQGSFSSSNPLPAIHEIEVMLHRHVRHRLEECFGTQNDAWWVNGIPLLTRQDCVKRREDSPERHEPYTYIYLIDQKSIIEKNWQVFEADFLKVREIAESKKAFLDDLVHLNKIRNLYSHPPRAPQPGSKASDEALSFIQKVAGLMRKFCTVE